MQHLPTALLCVAICLGGGAAKAASPTAADRAFVAKVSQGGMFEVEAGKLASGKASAIDVRDFATAEVHDHMLVGHKLTSISASEGIVLGSSLNAEFSSKLNHLSGLSGPSFDKAYLGEMADLHDADGAAFAKEASDGGSAAFRALGAETHRIVERHIGAIRAVPAK
jgi:putative membrane protein